MQYVNLFDYQLFISIFSLCAHCSNYIYISSILMVVPLTVYQNSFFKINFVFAKNGYYLFLNVITDTINTLMFLNGNGLQVRSLVKSPSFANSHKCFFVYLIIQKSVNKLVLTIDKRLNRSIRI